MPKNHQEKGERNMKRLGVLTIVLLLTLAFSMLTACSNSSNSSSGNPGNNNNNNNNSSSSSNSNNSNGLVGGVVDLDNDNNYFMIADGKKYGLKTTLQDLLNDGFVPTRTSLNLDSEVKAGAFLVDTIFLAKDGVRYFGVQVGNPADKPLPLSQCEIREMYINTDGYTNITVVGDLRLGCSKDDVFRVFGEDVQLNSDTLITYIAKGDNNRIFTFRFDESGRAESIRFTVYK